MATPCHTCRQNVSTYCNGVEIGRSMKNVINLDDMSKSIITKTGGMSVAKSDILL